jgi:ribosomal protein S18 acetylase RimI-like enzyme
MSGNAFQVRAYESGDQEQVLQLAGRLTEVVAAWLDRQAVASAARNWILESIGSMGESAAMFVVDDGSGNVLGFASVAVRQHFTGVQQAYIGELAVAANAEGRGVGRALVEEVERWAMAHELPAVTLETGSDNHHARLFYQRLGYQEESVTLTRVPGSSESA